MNDQVLDKIKQSDFYQEIVRKEETEQLDKRKAAAQALASIDGDTEKRIRGIIKTISEAEKIAAEAEKAHQEAIARVAQLRAERNGAVARAEREKRGHHSLLTETADPRIDQAIVWFRDRFDELRRGTATSQTHLGGFDLANMKRKVSTISNHKAREAALRYCQTAIETLQGMKLLPEVSQEELEKLAANLPDPENAFTENQGQKVERDPNHLPPWAKIKSDAIHDMDMDYLRTKADDLRRKRA